MFRKIIVGCTVLILSLPLVCNAFPAEMCPVPPPVVQTPIEQPKQRAERVVIQDQNGNPAISFILVYQPDGTPAGFMVVDKDNRVFMRVLQDGGK